MIPREVLLHVLKDITRMKKVRRNANSAKLAHSAIERVLKRVSLAPKATPALQGYRAIILGSAVQALTVRKEARSPPTAPKASTA